MAKDGLVGKVYSVPVKHIYIVGGFYDDAPKRHACLNEGWWCWSNFFRHPQDIIKYFKKLNRRRV